MALFLVLLILIPIPAFSQTTPSSLPAKLEEQAKAQVESASKLKDEGKTDAAIELLQKLVSDLPQSAQIPQAYLLLGQMQSGLKNYDEAAGYYRRLLEEYPESPQASFARLGLINALLATGQLNAALPLLMEAKAQSVDPDEKLVLLRQIEEASLGTQDYLRAVDAVVEAGPLVPEGERKKADDRVRELIKTKLSEKDLRRIADKFSRMFPADEALLRLMELYEAAGDDFKAARIARDFTARFPEHAKASAVAAAQAAQRQRLKSKTIRIGALLPLSGNLGPYGTEVLNGIRIAIDHAAEVVPTLAAGLVAKDTEGDPKILAREVEDLLKEYQPVAVLGPLLSREVKAVAPMADATEVVFMSPTATLTDPQRYGRYVFNAAVNNRALVRDLAAYATGTLGWKRFCILAARDTYGDEMTQAFKEEIRRLGGEIIAVETYGPEENDFGPPIKRLKEADLKKYGKMEKIENPKKAKNDKIYQPGFDAIFLPGDAEKVSLLAGQVGFYAAKVGVLGTNGMNSPELLRLDPRGVEAAIFADSFSVDSSYPAVQNFVKRYEKRFQALPSAFAAQAYEATLLILDAVARGATNGRALRESLKAAKNVPGLIGPLTMSPAGSLERRYALIQVKNGKFASIGDAQ